jgi:hypothetical protein
VERTAEEQVEREYQIPVMIETGETKGEGSEKVDDGDHVDSKEIVPNTLLSTSETAILEEGGLECQSNGKAILVLDQFEEVFVSLRKEGEGGPEEVCVINKVMCDSGELEGQKRKLSKGKEVMVWVDNKSNYLLKGSCSIWANKNMGVGPEIIIDEHLVVTGLKDKEVVSLDAEYLKTLDLGRSDKVITGGCKKRPLFFGSTKWAHLSTSHEAKGQRGRGKKGQKQKKKKKVRNYNNSCEDEIQVDDNSDSVGYYNDSMPQQKMIPISNNQVVLNEGEDNCEVVDDIGDVRIEAERLFYIGMNLGVTSNEERLQTLDRMVDAECKDVENYVKSGGHGGDR